MSLAWGDKAPQNIAKTDIKAHTDSFMVSGLTFKSLIHFEFIFVCGVRKKSSFILVHVAIQFSNTIYLFIYLF